MNDDPLYLGIDRRASLYAAHLPASYPISCLTTHSFRTRKPGSDRSGFAYRYSSHAINDRYQAKMTSIAVQPQEAHNKRQKLNDSQYRAVCLEENRHPY